MKSRSDAIECLFCKTDFTPRRKDGRFCNQCLGSVDPKERQAILGSIWHQKKLISEGAARSNCISCQTEILGKKAFCVLCLKSIKPDKRKKIWSEVNQKRLKERKRERTMEREYGLSRDDYEKLLLSAENKCQVCKREPPKNAKGPDRLHIDHDHKTGKVRGLLCRQCNTAIGLFGDCKETLQSATEYLERTQNGKKVSNSQNDI